MNSLQRWGIDAIVACVGIIVAFAGSYVGLAPGQREVPADVQARGTEADPLVIQRHKSEATIEKWDRRICRGEREAKAEVKANGGQ